MSILDNRNQLKNQQMFFGDGHFIQEFIQPKYPWALKSVDQQLAQQWPFDEFSLKLDAAQLASSNQAIRHIFTSNLQSQIVADSIQGRGPAWLIPYVSDSNLEYAFNVWGTIESLHSRTYTRIVTSMYPNPNLVMDMVDQKPEIHQRFKLCTEAYDTFFANPTKENLVLLIAAINILEGLSFYISFICNFGFANMNLFESVAKYLRQISFDERLHVALTQNILNTWRKGLDGDEWVQIWNDNSAKIRNMWFDAINTEIGVWNPYLFKYGTPIVGVTVGNIADSVEYYGNKRMKNLGIKPFSKITKDPLPWMQTKYLSNKAYQAAPQEVSVSEYLKNPIEKIQDTSNLRALLLNGA